MRNAMYYLISAIWFFIALISCITHVTIQTLNTNEIVEITNPDRFIFVTISSGIMSGIFLFIALSTKPED